MRVLHAISGIDPSNGGPTFALLGLTGALARLGLEVEVVATWQRDEGPAFAEQFRRRGVEVTMIGRARGALSRHPDLRRIVAERVRLADVVHVHGVWEQIQYEAANRASEAGRPLVVAPHGMLDPWNMRRGQLKKWLFYHLRTRRWLTRAAAVHAISPAEAMHLSRLGLPANIITEPCGIEPEEFESLPPPGFLTGRFPTLRDTPRLLFLSRFDPKKGIDVLLPALRLLADRRVDARLVMAGPDYQGHEAEVRRRVGELRLEDRVLFAGMLHGSDRIAALVDADLFVLTSHAENFGIACIEAMAAGRAVVVSEQVAACEEVRRCDGGIVVRRDPMEIADAIERLLSATELRADMGRRGRQHVLSRLTWPPIASRWIERYRALSR